MSVFCRAACWFVRQISRHQNSVCQSSANNCRSIKSGKPSWIELASTFFLWCLSGSGFPPPRHTHQTHTSSLFYNVNSHDVRFWESSAQQACLLASQLLTFATLHSFFHDSSWLWIRWGYFRDRILHPLVTNPKVSAGLQFSKSHVFSEKEFSCTALNWQ